MDKISHLILKKANFGIVIIAENKLVTTFFNSEEKILVSEYKGRVKIDLALEHLAQLVRFYDENEVKGSVADLSKLHGSFAKVTDFLTTSYYPAGSKSGLQCQAYVVSNDLIIENLGFQLNALASKFGIRSIVGTSRIDAEKWVRANI